MITDTNPDLHQKLASYYLDVLSSEITEGISEFASSRYGFPDYALIESGNPISSEGSPYQSNWVRDFINKRKGSTAINRVALGYPNAIKEVTSKKGNTFYVVIPLFLIPYQNSYCLSESVESSIFFAGSLRWE